MLSSSADFGTFAPQPNPTLTAVRRYGSELSRLLLDLAHSIAWHDGLDSLCSGLAKALRRVASFDYLGLTLYDPAHNRLWLHALNGRQLSRLEEPRAFPPDHTFGPGMGHTKAADRPLWRQCAAVAPICREDRARWRLRSGLIVVEGVPLPG